VRIRERRQQWFVNLARIAVPQHYAVQTSRRMHWKIFAASLAIPLSTFAQTPSPSPPVNSSGKRPFTFEDMMKLKRVGAPVPSPDGKWVVFDAVDVDLEANTKISHLWIVPANGGESRRL